MRGCCGTGRGPRIAVLSCAGLYVSGAAGSNACPAGSVRIEAEAACRAAAAAAGTLVGSGSGFSGTWSDYPKGCYYYTSNNYAAFNTHVVGAGNPNAQLLCAAVTGPTGAPRFARACVHRLGQRPSACSATRMCRMHACAIAWALRHCGSDVGTSVRAQSICKVFAGTQMAIA